MARENPHELLIDRLLREHRKIRSLAAELSAILCRPEPRELDGLARVRWEMASTIMAHLALEDRSIYNVVEHDPREHVRSLARRFRTELIEAFDRYCTHIEDWSASRIAKDWDIYRKEGLSFIAWLLARADREEAELFPLFVAKTVEQQRRIPVMVSWARNAFRLKDSITGI